MTLPNCAICHEPETKEHILFFKEFEGGDMQLCHEECFERMVLRHV